MKLATALSERSDLQKRLSEIGIRLNNNSKVQEGEEPSESPQELMQELISRINLTNSITVHEGERITTLLARRDCLKNKIQILRSFLDSASSKVNRMTHTEIKIHSTVAVGDIQKQLDLLSKQLRTLDERIQELNWTTELL